MKRKRGHHKPQNPSTATSPNDIVPIPTTEPSTTDPNNPSSSPTRGRGGGARPRKNPRPNIAASPERRGSRHADQNGDFTHSTTTNTAATAIAATTSDAVGVSEPVKWETVVKVVPSMDAVVKVFCVHTEPNFSLMWQRKRQYSSSSSGFIIGGRRVLTNAHSVEHHTQVKLKKRGSDTKYLATVLAIGTECDIGMGYILCSFFFLGCFELICYLGFGENCLVFVFL